ncbi:unnamed protein product [Brassica rapa subsp. trilocularis]
MERFFVVVIVVYGFTMTVSGSQVEYANDDFVRGQPERLEKICEPFVARLKQDNELRLKLNNGKPKLIKKTSEKHKPAMIAYSKKFRERMDAFIPNPAMEKRRRCPPNLKLWRGNVAPIHGLSKVVRHSLLLSQSLGNLLKYQ